MPGADRCARPRRPAGCRRRWRSRRPSRRPRVGGVPPLLGHPAQHRARRALADRAGHPVVGQVHAAHPGLGGERDERGTVQLALVPGRAGRTPSWPARRWSGPRGSRRPGRTAGRRRRARRPSTPGTGTKRAGLAVAEGDGAGLVQQQGGDVAGGLDGAAGHGQHVALHQPVHAGDADRREQRADGGGDQADQQGDEHDHRLLAAGVGRERLEGHDGEQEDDRQRGEQDVQRDLVGRLLPRRALDEGDHPVDEGLAGLGRDPHDDAVREHLGAAGDRGAVAAGLADDRRGLAGDGRLVHAGDALDDVAVAGDDLAGLDDDQVADAELRAGDLLLGAPRRAARRRSAGAAAVSVLARRSVAAWALPRPSATASARLANSTVTHSQPAIARRRRWGRRRPGRGEDASRPRRRT